MNPTNSSKTRIEELPLHDATLESAAFDWKSGELRIVLSLVDEDDMAVLSFIETTRFSAVRDQPWGKSVSLNEVRALADGAFEVELQSGDTWNIQAPSWSLTFPLRHEA